MLREAQKLKEICGHNVIFLIDDRVDIALAVDADGVHIGQDDIPIETARRLLGPDKIIGLTVHNVDEALEAERLGADYIGLAPIFQTDTKEDSGEPCGVEMITQVHENVCLPIIAVGGIDKSNVTDVIKKGADGFVSVSAILNSDNVEKEIEDYIKIMNEVKG
jgi:thiamine-phosphate pyrophosphorylase